MSYFIVLTASNNHYLIGLNFEKTGIVSTSGSFAVVAARVANLSYVDYLKWCKAHYGAEIVGKNSTYPLPYFKNKADAEKVAAILEKRLILGDENNEDVNSGGRC